MKGDKIRIQCTSREIRSDVIIPGSKSESNRALIISYLSKNRIKLNNLSDADDTKELERFIKEISSGTCKNFDLGPSGTGLRFLTAALAVSEKDIVLTGSERLRQRPIQPLLSALKKLGADIQFPDQEDTLPYRIRGKKLSGGSLIMDATISSQFISALMLIGPTLSDELVIQLKGKVVSEPYIRMTESMMRNCGINIESDIDTITVQPGEYKSTTITIEGDWSSASYWYEIAALSDRSEIRLNNLKSSALQGDQKCAEIFHKLFNVETVFNEDHIIIKKNTSTSNTNSVHTIDLSNTPDLAQAIAVTSAFYPISLKITGLSTLKVKETNRLEALTTELTKCGVKISGDGESFLEIDGRSRKQINKADIETYKDHRMAMAFAPVALKGIVVTIQDPEIVSKSYPSFWTELAKSGFNIS